MEQVQPKVRGYRVEETSWNEVKREGSLAAAWNMHLHLAYSMELSENMSRQNNGPRSMVIKREDQLMVYLLLWMNEEVN